MDRNWTPSIVPNGPDQTFYMLLLVAELDGPPMFARIGIMRALNRGYVREFNTSRKGTRWGQRKLKRDL